MPIKPRALGLLKTWKAPKRALPKRYRSSAKLFRSFYVLVRVVAKDDRYRPEYPLEGKNVNTVTSETRNLHLQIYHGAAQVVL